MFKRAEVWDGLWSLCIRVTRCVPFGGEEQEGCYFCCCFCIFDMSRGGRQLFGVWLVSSGSAAQWQQHFFAQALVLPLAASGVAGAVRRSQGPPQCAAAALMVLSILLVCSRLPFVRVGCWLYEDGQHMQRQ